MGRSVRKAAGADERHKLSLLLRDVAYRLSTVPGLEAVRSVAGTGDEEVQVIVNRDRAAQLGVTTQQVALTVTGAMRGDKLPELQDVPGFNDTYLDDGRVPAEGFRLRQPLASASVMWVAWIRHQRRPRMGISRSISAKTSSAMSIALPPTTCTPSDQPRRAHCQATCRNDSVGVTWMPQLQRSSG